MDIRGAMSKTKWALVAAFGLGGALAAIYSNELISLGLLAAGRNRGCDFQGAWPGISVAKAQGTIEDSIRAQSKLLKRDVVADLELWDTPSGPYWVPAGSAGAAFYDLSEQRRGIYNPGGLGVRPGDVVLDCGANIGTYAKTALAAGASKVLAIEPVPQNLECLRRNLANEIASGKVVLVAKGVWNKDDQLTINVDPKNQAGASFVGTRGGEAHNTLLLPLTTIDRIVEELGLSRVDFIKMDIEGAERQALAGGGKTIARFHPRMALSVYHLEDDTTVIPSLALSYWSGYQRLCGPCRPGEGRLNAEVYLFH